VSNLPEPVPVMKWWGWGDPAHHGTLPPDRLAALRAEIGAPERATPAVAADAVRVADGRVEPGVRERLEQIVGAGSVRDDRMSRIVHAAGKGYPDLLRMRAGDADPAPDVVVYPGGPEDVRRVLDLCAAEGLAVVPFGGGTSVVGGVEPVRDGKAAVVSLDMERLSAVGPVDPASLTVVLGAGLRGPAMERALGASGYTLGHFPQSFEYSSVGGWIATRSAGQASTGYGTIEKLVTGLRLTSPSGEIEAHPVPASAAGPKLRELLVGSEGVLGVITAATVQVRPLPAERRYEGWMFHSFEEGAEALRALEQGGAATDVARLSDADETRLSLLLAGTDSATQRVGRRYVAMRGYGEGCLAILGWEGDATAVRRRRAVGTGILRRSGGLSLGTRPGQAWARSRYEGPYLRDALMDNGIFVETLETATQWSNLMNLYGAVRSALADAMAARGTPGLVGCHVSHLYPSGASLYYTFLAAREEAAPLEQWRAVKSAACDAIVGAGGTITHHHAIGRDHAPWMDREIGDLGIAALRALKGRLDPAGVMNPGKLLPREPGEGP
jgi:alkyldihydroxyacetonephosphate synthase